MNTFFQKALYLVVTAYPDIGRSIRRIICLLSLSLVALSNCYAQSGWFCQNPLPPNNSIYSIKFLNQNTGYIVGFNNTIVKTTNAGLNWIYLTNDYDKHYTSSQFVNVNTGFVIGNYSVFKTNNGGLNWQYSFSSIEGISFVDNNTGYAVGSSLLYKTVDGGLVWSTVSSVNARAVCFLNATTGFAGFNNLYKTTNSGLNWITIEGIEPYLQLKEFCFINEQTGYIIGSQILRTTNGGNNWVYLVSGTTEYMRSIAFQNANTGIVTAGNTLMKTTDSGASWYAIFTLNNETFNAVCYSDINTIYTGLHSGSLYKSTDGGISWISAAVGPRNHFRSISFPSADSGYCAGSGGAILFTSNAGDQWNLLNTGVNCYFNSILFKDNLTGFAAADSGRIISTTNGGNSWLNRITGVSRDLKSISASNNSTIYICGKAGTILKTTDNGANWQQLTSGVNANLNCICFVDSSTGYCAGGNLIIKTTNSGQNWAVKYTVLSSPSELFAAYFINNMTGYVTGVNIEPNPPHFQATYIYKTTNGGENWVSQYLPYYLGGGSNAVYFTNENTGYISSGYFIFRTIDKGITWSFSKTITSTRIYSIFFTSQNTGFAAGDNGTILKTNDMGGPIVGTISNSANLPTFPSLSQNYPNPFNPQTKIKFDIPANVKGQTSNVKLVIYDLLGREVTTLVNEELKPGTYELIGMARISQAACIFIR